jgi:hypothetical protein
MVNTFNCFGRAGLKKTFECLDMGRLTKQLVEVIQLVEAITNPTKGFRNHPVTRMWMDHVSALIDYGLVCVSVIAERFPDYKYQMMEGKLLNNPSRQADPVYPAWFEDEQLCMSHRASLFFKSPEIYSQFEAEARLYEQYAWPVPVAKPSLFFETIMEEFHKKIHKYETKPWKHSARRPEPTIARANYVLRVQHVIVGKGHKVPSYEEFIQKEEKRRRNKKN